MKYIEIEALGCENEQQGCQTRSCGKEGVVLAVCGCPIVQCSEHEIDYAYEKKPFEAFQNDELGGCVQYSFLFQMPNENTETSYQGEADEYHDCYNHNHEYAEQSTLQPLALLYAVVRLVEGDKHCIDSARRDIHRGNETDGQQPVVLTVQDVDKGFLYCGIDIFRQSLFQKREKLFCIICGIEIG